MLGLALWSRLHEEAGRLLGAGANINEKNSEGMTLLHQAIEKQDTSSALFLIEHKADLTIKYISECLPVTCSINHVYNDVSVYKRKLLYMCQRMNIEKDKLISLLKIKIKNLFNINLKRQIITYDV